MYCPKKETMSNPVETVLSVFDARRAGDTVKVYALCAEAFTFTCNADPDKVGSGTTRIGWAAVHGHLAQVAEYWEQLDSRIQSIGVDSDNAERVIVQISFKLLHRASRDVLEGVKRQEWYVRDGIATRMDEILDAGTIHAFQRYAESRVAAKRDDETTR